MGYLDFTDDDIPCCPCCGGTLLYIRGVEDYTLTFRISRDEAGYPVTERIGRECDSYKTYERIYCAECSSSYVGTRKDIEEEGWEVPGWMETHEYDE